MAVETMSQSIDWRDFDIILRHALPDQYLNASDGLKAHSNSNYKAWLNLRERLKKDQDDPLWLVSWAFNLPGQNRKFSPDQVAQVLGLDPVKVQCLLLLADVFHRLSGEGRPIILKVKDGRPGNLVPGDRWGPKVVVKDKHVFQIYGPELGRQRNELKDRLEVAEKARRTLTSSDEYGWELGLHGSDILKTPYIHGNTSLNKHFQSNKKGRFEAVQLLFNHFLEDDPEGKIRIIPLKISLDQMKLALPRFVKAKEGELEKIFGDERMISMLATCVTPEKKEVDSYCFIHGDEWGENFILADRGKTLFAIDLEDSVLLQLPEDGGHGEEDFLRGTLTTCGGRLAYRIESSSCPEGWERPTGPHAMSTLFGAARLYTALIQFRSKERQSPADRLSPQDYDLLNERALECIGTFTQGLSEEEQRSQCLQFMVGCWDWALLWGEKGKFPDVEAFIDSLKRVQRRLFDGTPWVEKVPGARSGPSYLSGPPERLEFKLARAPISEHTRELLKTPMRMDNDAERFARNQLLDAVDYAKTNPPIFIDFEDHELHYLSPHQGGPFVNMVRQKGRRHSSQVSPMGGVGTVHVRIDAGLQEGFDEGAWGGLAQEAERWFREIHGLSERAGQEPLEFHFEVVDYPVEPKFDLNLADYHKMGTTLFFECALAKHHAETLSKAIQMNTQRVSRLFDESDHPSECFVLLNSVIHPAEEDLNSSTLHDLHDKMPCGVGTICVAEPEQYNLALSQFFEQVGRALLCNSMLPERKKLHLHVEMAHNSQTFHRREETMPIMMTNIYRDKQRSGSASAHDTKIESNLDPFHRLFGKTDLYLFKPNQNDALQYILNAASNLARLKRLHLDTKPTATEVQERLGIAGGLPAFTERKSWQKEVEDLIASLGGENLFRTSEWGKVAEACDALVGQDVVLSPTKAIKTIACVARLHLALSQFARRHGNAPSTQLKFLGTIETLEVI